MFWKNKKLAEIQKKLMNQRDTINSHIKQLSVKDRNRIEWCTIHQRECMSTGLLMWEKDLDHKYTFLNSRHCNDFFRVSLADVRGLIGKTDQELIKDFTARTGLKNTFAEMCITTDKYTMGKEEPTRFWELGYIGDSIFILDVTKKPLIKNGKIVGIQSWALNQSAKECEIKALLELFLQTGEAVRLDKTRGKRIAAYLINKKINPFNGVFPK